MKRPFRVTTVLFTLGLALSFARPSSADDGAAPTAERTAAAKTLFDQAQSLMDQKNYKEACTKFYASNLQVQRVGTLLNLADCYEKNGQNASAWATYNDAIALGRRQARPDFEEFARKKVSELEPHLVRLTIKVPKDAIVEGLAIQRDGVAIDVGAWETAMPIDPGPHQMTVSAPKKIKRTVPIQIDSTSPNTDFVVTPLDDAPVEKPKIEQQIVTKVVEKPSFWTTPRTIGLVVGVVGVATLVGGAATGGGAAATWSSAKTSCNRRPDGLCTPGSDAPTLASTASTLATVSTALFVVGSVLTAGGVVVFLLGGKKATEPHVALAPTFGGLSVSGSW